MKLTLTFFMTFYTDVKEMTAFAITNFTKVMGTANKCEQVLQLLPHYVSWYFFNFVKMVSEIPLHVILFWQYVCYEISFFYEFLLLRFAAEIYNKQVKEVDSNIQPLLKEIFQKFDECENCTTLVI